MAADNQTDERIVAQWQSIMLTTSRVIGRSRSGGAAWLVLGAVQWAGIVHHRPTWLLWAALATWAVPLSVGRELAIPAAVVCGVLLAAYALNRRVFVTIGAGAGEVVEQVRGGGEEIAAANAFVRTVMTHIATNRAATRGDASLQV